jgi:hypothetical protein
VSFDKFAIEGGEPSSDQTLHVGRLTSGDREWLIVRLDDMLDSKCLTNNGPFVQNFEEALAGYLDLRHHVAMCNGTMILEITA